MPVRVLALPVVAIIASSASASAAVWSPQSTIDPTGALATTFRAVSCPSVRFCVAVGTTGPTYNPGTALIERWNGSSWMLDAVSPPVGSSAALKDVSCTSARSCLAVGNEYTSTSVAFAEHWDGARWTALTPAAPAGSSGTDLHAVSCTTSSACVAVGIAYFPAGRYQLPHPLIERWDGSSWTLQPTPDLNSSADSLDDVSCSSGAACTAVGFYTRPGTGQVPLVERWQGSAWAIQDTPAILDEVYNQFVGVSCPRRRFCEAVGYVTTTMTTQGIAERWNGSSWTREATPGPLSGPSQLLGVTCGPRGRCSAVGEVLASPTGNELPLSERRTPAGWRVETTSQPAGGTFGRLWGVSCSGHGHCTAVGWWGTGLTGLRPLAERRTR